MFSARISKRWSAGGWRNWRSTRKSFSTWTTRSRDARQGRSGDQGDGLLLHPSAVLGAVLAHRRRRLNVRNPESVRKLHVLVPFVYLTRRFLCDVRFGSCVDGSLLARVVLRFVQAGRVQSWSACHSTMSRPHGPCRTSRHSSQTVKPYQIRAVSTTEKFP